MVCFKILSRSAKLVLLGALLVLPSLVHSQADVEVGKVTSKKSVLLKPAKSVDLTSNPFFKDCRKVLPASPITAGTVILQDVSANSYYLTAVLTSRKGVKVYLRNKEALSFLEPDTFGKINISTEIKIPDEGQKIEIPIAADIFGKMQNYFFVISLKKDQVEASLVSDLSDPDRSELCLRDQVWLGSGISAFRHSQEISQIDANSSFQSFRFGSYSIEMKTFPKPEIGIVGSYKSAIGKVDPGQVAAVTQTNFRWNTVSLEVQYRASDWSRAWKSWNVYPFLKTGFQNHSLPRITIDNVSQVGFDSINILNAHVGGGINMIDNSRSYFETYFNYQIPVSTKNYSVSAKFMFDGSLGYGYALDRRWTLGAFWYGQWHSMDYASSGGVDTKPGNLNIFFSNFEIKLGYLF